ncbi:helix-turn-helix protein [Actinocorallia herbida]|uniref:Helix-turn-helix protein n=1 Tax=Actinocorallia herbida TaxID=58109 RepID=A0A3N1CNH4_9ACTN|nr:helix-turn-helix transcriptional regulator [Actinocorallia herbida]ROO82877.1 helix-turn-helix protein [Actinocorallia herbida]
MEELRVRREADGLSRVKLAELLGCTRQWLDKVETLERVPSEALAADLDTQFKTHGTFQRIWAALDEARRLRNVPTGFRPVIEIERDAKRIRFYEPVLVPGLFQTEAYARTVFKVRHPPAVVEEQVGIRLARQKVLEKAKPPWIFLLLRENVVRDIPGHLRPEQCKRLLERSEQFTISIQILPIGAEVFESSAFQLIASETSEIAYAESVNGFGQSVRDPDKVSEFALLFERARSSALSVEESRNRIQAIMEDA